MAGNEHPILDVWKWCPNCLEYIIALAHEDQLVCPHCGSQINPTFLSFEQSASNVDEADLSGIEEVSDLSGQEEDSDLSGQEEDSDLSGVEEVSDLSGQEEDSDLSGPEEDSDLSAQEEVSDLNMETSGNAAMIDVDLIIHQTMNEFGEPELTFITTTQPPGPEQNPDPTESQPHAAPDPPPNSPPQEAAAEHLNLSLFDFVAHLQNLFDNGGRFLVNNDFGNVVQLDAWDHLDNIDAIITRLMEENDEPGVAPMTGPQMDAIPREKITEEQIGSKLQCHICQEDFIIDEETLKLVCCHQFHSECITPWLSLHATCPVCRKVLNESSEESSSSESFSVGQRVMNMFFNPNRAETYGSERRTQVNQHDEATVSGASSSPQTPATSVSQTPVTSNGGTILPLIFSLAGSITRLITGTTLAQSGTTTTTSSTTATGNFPTRTSAPYTISPGTTAPGPTAPGTTAPGTTAPGTTSPGTTAPGTTSPRTTAPRTTTPGTTAPITTASGTTASGTTAPSTTAPETYEQGTAGLSVSAPATSEIREPELAEQPVSSPASQAFTGVLTESDSIYSTSMNSSESTSSEWILAGSTISGFTSSESSLTDSSEEDHMDLH